jgi:hypothetical protein
MYDIQETRRVYDRRRFSWRTVFNGFMRSRRRDHRRVADAEVAFLDWHHPWLFFLSTGVMLLSACDAALTLQLLERGFFEANPVMAAIMEHSTMLFATMKMGMTGLGVLMLVYMAKAQFMDRVRVGVFLTSIFVFYAGLICYEIVSLFSVL